MRPPYSDYFEKQKTTYTLQYTQVFFRKMLGAKYGSVGTRFLWF